MLVVPADVANAAALKEPPDTVHARRPLIRPSDADLDEIATMLHAKGHDVWEMIVDNIP